MLAIIETGSKQYLVKTGEKILIEKIKDESIKDDAVFFDKVLLMGDEKEVRIGSPFIEGAKVEAKIIGEKKAKKVITIKHKAKKRYFKKQGHRQQMIEVEIGKIN